MNFGNKLLLLLGITLGTVSQAATITQTTPFTFTDSGTDRNGSFTLAAVGDFSASVNPFDSALGTLNSFEIIWGITVFANGTTGGSGGSFNTSGGGTYQLNTTGYSGNGGGGSDGNGPNLPITFTFSVPDDHTFLPADAGLSYDPAMLAAVTGASPFSVSWTAEFVLSTASLATWNSSIGGSVSVVYDYTPADAPEPATFAMIGGALVALAAFKRYSR